MVEMSGKVGAKQVHRSTPAAASYPAARTMQLLSAEHDAVSPSR